jgi:predicted site-specific integrase-resolvase
VAAALDVSQYTVQARWCNAGRIECEKDPDTRKWRIPAREYARLTRGGSPRAGRKPR